MAKASARHILVEDEDFCKELIQSGARWFLLQFDSLHEEELTLLRGRSGLAEKRKAALENLSGLGAEICLACMIHRNSNLARLESLGPAPPGSAYSCWQMMGLD